MGFNIGKLKSTSEGQWVEVGGGLRVKVARLGNPDYENALRKAAKPFMRQMRLGTMDIEDMEKLSMKAISQHIVQGWAGLEDEAGVDIPFSQAKALELFEKYPDFYTIVKEIAGEAEVFRSDEMEDAAGNSEDTSVGISTGESTNDS